MDITELERSGQLFEGWHVVRLLGEGGFGSVYEIEREEFGVKMRSALKVISIPKNKGDVNEVMSEGMDEKSASNYFREYVEELSSECSIMLKLKGNSNIVSFEDYKVVEHKGEIGWDILIRMEMLTPLIEYMKDHTLSEREVLNIGISICEALSLCKKHNIMHRDIKPANIFISSNGDYKLGDFGISRIVEKSNGASTRVGTIDYIAPEIFRGEKYDSRVDIYSLGLVLYRLLNNNRLPFLPPAPQPISQSQREEANLMRLRAVQIPKPAGMSNETYRVISKAAAYNPDDRYQDPMDLRADLMNLKRSLPAEKKENIKANTTVEPHPVMPPVDDYKPTEVLTPENVDRLTEIFTPADQAVAGQQAASQIVKPKVEPQNQQIYTPPVVDRSKTAVVSPKKKSKLPVILASFFGGVVFLFILLMVLASLGSRSSHRASGSSSNSSTSGKQVSTSSTKSDDSSVKTTNNSEATKQGKLIIQSGTVLKGDTVNTQFVAGDMYLFWAEDLVYTSSDESVATVRRSKDGQRFVVEGKEVGVAEITGTYGEYTATVTIRVIDFDESNILAEYDYQYDDLYDYMVENGMSAGGTYTLATFGKTQVPFDAFGTFDTMGFSLAEIGKSVYYYSSENIRLGIDSSTEGNSWVITITDLGGYPTDGELTVLMTDSSDENALCAFRIPVNVE